MRTPRVCNVHEMNAENPLPWVASARSCWSRTRSRLATRCAGVSPNPITMVAVVYSPRACASPMMRIQSSAPMRPGATCVA